MKKKNKDQRDWYRSLDGMLDDRKVTEEFITTMCSWAGCKVLRSCLYSIPDNMHDVAEGNFVISSSRELCEVRSIEGALEEFENILPAIMHAKYDGFIRIDDFRKILQSSIYCMKHYKSCASEEVFWMHLRNVMLYLHKD